MNVSLLKSAACGAALLLSLSAMTASAVAESFHQGDQLVVTQSGTPLKRGTQTLATLPQGHRLSVLRTEGEWVGTTAVVNGETVGGWIHQRQVATPAQYAQRRTSRRSFSYQPGVAGGGMSGGSSYSGGSYYSGRSRSTNSNRGFIMGATPYGPSYWRADRKIKGY
ncbi:MAG TPA: hypothetical protein VFI31_17015 [Pirellulales bacterium]|nr:hypothetical protein [Pirellulales bacterium]